MTQLMHDLIPVLQVCILGVVVGTGLAIGRELMRATATRERKQITEALGHEPDDEDLEDYRQLWREHTSKQKAYQKEEDRKKIIRFIEGNADAA